MRIKKILITFEALLLLVVVSLYSSQVFGKQDGSSREEEKIPGQYIVVLNDNVNDSDLENIFEELSSKHKFEAQLKFKHSIKGFSANISDADLVELKKDSRVKFVSEDRVVYADAKANRLASPQPAQVIPSGVSRMGQTSSTNIGSGVVVAVLDTVIDFNNPDLSCNVLSVNKSCITLAKNANDDNGHGTHVAGTIAAINNSIGVVGVAPSSKLLAVKVLNRSGSGTWSSVICGIDFVTANASKYGIKVANMSLGGGGSSDNNCGNTNGDALHQAICRSVSAGVTYVVAAGNESGNTAMSVPASYNDAVITVSALSDSDGKSDSLGAPTSYGADDTFASFSNYGGEIDLGAPGVNIYSTWKGGGYNTISGTSMASPHVSGAAALYLSTHSGSSWTEVRDNLISLGESLNFGHTDPSGLHPEKVLTKNGL